MTLTHLCAASHSYYSFFTVLDVLRGSKPTLGHPPHPNSTTAPRANSDEARQRRQNQRPNESISPRRLNGPTAIAFRLHEAGVALCLGAAVGTTADQGPRMEGRRYGKG